MQQHSGVIELQGSNRAPPGGSETHHFRTVPHKMVGPDVETG